MIKNGPGKTEKASIVDKLAVREGVNVLEVREGVDKLAVREGMDKLAVREGMCVNKLDVRERDTNWTRTGEHSGSQPLSVRPVSQESRQE